MLRERVEGPEELEAHITSLDILTNYSRREQRLALRGIFVSFIKTTIYKFPKGETPPLSPSAAKQQILIFYNNADGTLQKRMGAALWWSLIKADPAKDEWVHVLKELKPIADKGYNDKIFQPHYDEFLKLKGITYP
jgi:hypothetical protein